MLVTGGAAFGVPLSMSAASESLLTAWKEGKGDEKQGMFVEIAA